MEKKSIGQCCIVLLAHWPIESCSTVRRYALLHAGRLHTGTVYNLIFGWTSCVSAKANVGESKIRSAKAVPHGCSAIWDTWESRHTGQRRKTSSGSVATSGKDYVIRIIAGAQRYYQKVQPTPFNMSAFDPIAKLWCILTHMPYGRG